MTTLIKSGDAALRIDVQAGPDPMTALRIAIRTKALNSAALMAKLGGPFVFRPLPESATPHFPSITYYDFGTTQYAGQGPSAPTVWDGVWAFDVWATTGDEAEAIGFLVRRIYHQQPVAVLGDVARVESMRFVADRNDAAEEGDVARKTLTFRMLAYLRN